MPRAKLRKTAHWWTRVLLSTLLVGLLPLGTTARAQTPALPPGSAPATPPGPILTAPVIPAPTGTTRLSPPPASIAAPLTNTAPPLVPQVNMSVTVASTSAIVGSTVPFSVTATNGSTVAAPNTVVTVPVPSGTVPVAGPGVVNTTAGWQWTVGTLAPGTSTVLYGSVQITSAPPTGVLAFTPQATASGMTAVSALGGVPLVVPHTTATASYTPGSAATIQNTGDGVTVQLAPNVYSTTLQVRQRALSLAQADLVAHGDPVPPTLVNQRRAFEPFVLDATDAQGQAVHQFNQPITITVGYTPAQLDVLDIPEGALSLFWFDPQQQRWVLIPTSVDRAAHTATTVVNHFSTYALGSGASPSDAYLPSVKQWQVDLLTGAASFSYPIDAPAGPNGMKPNLTLSYNSTETDGTAYKREFKQGTWAGKGWSLEVPYIGLNRQPNDSTNHTDSIVLVLDGKRVDVVRAAHLPGYTTSHNSFAGWDWHATEETFVRVRYDKDPSNTHGGEGWVVWTKDGTRYEFRTTAYWHFTGEDKDIYKWMLSTVTDTHGNQMVYTYEKLAPTQCDTNPDIWPTRIQWGGNPAASTPVRYTLEFFSTARTSGDVWDQTRDMAWDVPAGTYGGTDAIKQQCTPHETRQLRYVRIRANTSTTLYQTGVITPGTPALDPVWPEVREYQFATNYTLTSDSDSTYLKLTLNGVQMLGKDRSNTVPGLSFQYGTSGPSKNRLLSVDNNQGGTVTFAYTDLTTVYSAAQANTQFGNTSYNPNVYENRFRVNQKTTTDGRGNTYVTKYTYGPFAVNTANNTQANPKPASNSAVLEREQSIYGTTGMVTYADYVSVLETKEFRGHESVTEKVYNTVPTTGTKALQWTEHYFRLGDVLDIAGCGAQVTFNDNASNTCYIAQREREFEKGREWQTIWKQDDGTTNGVKLRATIHTFALGTLSDIGSGQAAPNSNNTVDYTENVDRGLWRAFVYESATDEQSYEGQGTTRTKRTTYAYELGPQRGIQVGNLTRTDEFRADTNKVRTRKWEYIRADSANVTCNPSPTNCTSTTVGGVYIQDRQQQETDYDSTNVNGTGNLTALTNNYYDSTTVTSSTLTLGDLRRFTRYTDINAVTAPDTTGRTVHGVDTMYTYDTWGNRLTTTTYAGLSSRTTGTGGVVTWSTPQGAAATTTTTYDPYFHQYSTTTTNPPNAASVQTSAAADYDLRMGTLTVITDTNGLVSRGAYDPYGRITTIAKPGDTLASPTLSFAYYDAEQPVRYALQGKRTNDVTGDPLYEQYWFYDGLGELIQTKQESQGYSTQEIITNKRYDALGHVVAESQPFYFTSTSTTAPAYTAPVLTAGKLYRETSTTYDGLGRTLDVTDPLTHTAQTRYYQTSDGWAVSTTDVNNHKVRQEFDVLGRMTAAREYANGGSSAPDESTIYTYSPLDLLTQVVADYGATNITTNIGYDSAGRKTSMTDPDMGSWSYTYDGRGNLLTQTDARSVTTTFGYDLLSRLTQKTFSNSTPTMTYGYDDTATHTNGKSQRTSMCVSNGSGGCTVATDWNYDTHGNMAQQTQTASGLTRAVQWTYGADDNVWTIGYPDGHTLTYTYDAAGRQVWACLEVGGCAAGNATYTPLNQPTSRTAGNTLATTWTYNNPLSRLDRMQVGTVFDRSYGYDNGGNVTGITDNKTASNSQTFGYDQRDRLNSWTLNGTSQSYGYSPMGNLTSKAGVSYSYGQQSTGCSTGALTKPHAVIQAGSNSYCYDQNGNMLTGAGRTYTWNAQNQPTQITQTGVTESYTYDGDGNRALLTNGSTTTFYLAGLWEETVGGEQRAYYLLNNEMVAMAKGGTRLFVHGDHLGSVSLLTTSTQAVTGTQEFDPWGKVRTGGVTQTKRNFTGQQLDGTGLLYYNARYYDPSLARFTSADSIVPGTTMGSGGALGTLGQDKQVGLAPLTTDFHEPGFVSTVSGETSMRQMKGFWFQLSDDEQQQAPAPWGPDNPQALNRYSYVLNNPVRYNDPSGRVTLTRDEAITLRGVLEGQNGVIAQLQDKRDQEKLGVALIAGGLGGAIGGAVSTIAASGAAALGGTATALIAFIGNLPDAVGYDPNDTLSALNFVKELDSQLNQYISWSADPRYNMSTFSFNTSREIVKSRGTVYYYNNVDFKWGGRVRSTIHVSYEIYQEVNKLTRNQARSYGPPPRP